MIARAEAVSIPAASTINTMKSSTYECLILKPTHKPTTVWLTVVSLEAPQRLGLAL